MAARKLGVLCVASALFGLGRSVPSEQKPIGGVENDDVVHDGNANTGVKSRSANLLLYPASLTFPGDLRDMGLAMPACPDDAARTPIKLDTDVCLSGEYYVRDNLKLQESVRCADGSTPRAQFYQNRGCSGSRRQVIDDLDKIVGRCLWSEEENPVPSYYWSLIFRCDERYDGAEHHQTATPASVTPSVLGGAPGNLREHKGTMFPCHSDFANRTMSWDYAPDECRWAITTFGVQSIEVLSPAICANGTRAQLALFEDTGVDAMRYNCNNAEMTLENGLMDVDDWMINTCIDMTHLQLKRGGFGKALGVAFICDGVKFKIGETPKEPSNRGPKTSHNVCATSIGRWQWAEPEHAPTFFYPPTETCITLPKGQQVRLYEQASCPNGSVARFATWQEPGCEGWPRKIQGVDGTFRLNCENWNLQSDSSYMLWCAPEGLTSDERENGEKDDRAVVSRDVCPRLDLEPGWVTVGGEAGPTILRVEADSEAGIDCINVSKDHHWNIYSNAKCQDGGAAKLAKYKGSYCRGEPDWIEEIGDDMLNTCMGLCEDRSCSARFLCEGVSA